MVPNNYRICIVFGLSLILGLPVFADVNIKQSGTTSNNNFWNIPSFSTKNNDVYTTCTNSTTQSTYVSYTVQNSDSSSALTLRVRAIFDFLSFGNTPYITFYQHDSSYTWTVDDAQGCNFFQFASTSTSTTDLFVIVEPNHTLEIYLSGPSTQNSGKYAIEITQVQQTTVNTDSSSFWNYPTTSSCSPQSTDSVPFSKYQFDSSLCDPCDISLITSTQQPVFALYKASSSSIGNAVTPCQTGFVQAANSATQVATMRNVDLTSSVSYTVLSSIAGNDTAFLGLSVSPSLYGTTALAQRTWTPPVVSVGQQQSSCVDGSNTTPFLSYVVRVTTAGTYFFDTLPVPSETPFDAALYLYSSRITGTPSCSQFVKAGDSGNGGAIVADLTPGNYTLVVSSRTGTNSGSYMLYALASQSVSMSLIHYSNSTTTSTTGQSTTGQSTTGQSTTGQSTTGQSTTTGVSTTTGTSTPSNSPAPVSSPSPASPSTSPSPGTSPVPSASPDPSTTGVGTTGVGTTGVGTTGEATTGYATTGQSTTGEGTSGEPTTTESSTSSDGQSSSSGEAAVGGQIIIIIIAAVAGSAAVGLLIGIFLFVRKRANKDKKEPEEPEPEAAHPSTTDHVDGEYTPMQPIQRIPQVEVDPQRISETPSGSGVSSSDASGSQPKLDSDSNSSASSSTHPGSSRKETHPIYGNVVLDEPNRLRFILDRDVTICEKLGDGFFGEVYRGLWKGREVALKSFKEEEDDPTSFLNEAKLLQKLEHPNIVSFLGIFLGTNRRRYIAMEYMNGGSLQRFLLLKKSIITETDLVEMALQAADGMVFLESQSIVHRDLALRNLLVSYSESEKDRRKSAPRRDSQLHQETRWTVKVADFGLSRKADPGFYTSQTRTIPVKWSAPEVLLYQTYNYTSKCDVWSFGVVLWELFSFGMTPYPALSNAETVDSIQSGFRMAKPKQCPEEVYEVMLKCWEFDPEARPSFVEVHQQLQTILKARIEAEAAQVVDTTDSQS